MDVQKLWTNILGQRLGQSKNTNTCHKLLKYSFYSNNELNNFIWQLYTIAIEECQKFIDLYTTTVHHKSIMDGVYVYH